MKTLIFFIFIGFSVFASVVVSMDENRVIDASDVVLRGIVVDKTSDWGGKGKRIYTTYKIKVVEQLVPSVMKAEMLIHGSEFFSTIVDVSEEDCTDSVAVRASDGSVYVYIVARGGSIGRVAVNVSGSPRFNIGTEQVFFLKRFKGEFSCSSLRKYSYSVVGFSQGLCRVVKEKDVEKVKCGYLREPVNESMTGQQRSMLKAAGLDETLNSLRDRVVKRKNMKQE